MGARQFQSGSHRTQIRQLTPFRVTMRATTGAPSSTTGIRSTPTLLVGFHDNWSDRICYHCSAARGGRTHSECWLLFSLRTPVFDCFPTEALLEALLAAHSGFRLLPRFGGCHHNWWWHGMHMCAHIRALQCFIAVFSLHTTNFGCFLARMVVIAARSGIACICVHTCVHFSVLLRFSRRLQ